MDPVPDSAKALGSDFVWQEGDALVIDAACAFPGWAVSPHRPTVITYQGRPWALAAAEPGASRRMRYRLTPWQDTFGRVGWEETYDLAGVKGRDRASAQRRLGGVTGPLLTTLGPLLGYLWSGPKLTLAQTLGLDPRSATRQSILTSRVASVLGLALAFPLWGLSGERGLAIALGVGAVVLTLDSLQRDPRLARRGNEHLGLFEWVFRR